MEQELAHAMWRNYIIATQIDEALQVLAQEQSHARIVAGGTDIILEMERGVRQGIETLVDVTRINGLDQITLDERGYIHLGPLVTHNHCVSSKLIREYAFPLAQACLEVGSPQIRNRGTIAGNLITASPANDTITPLMALDASVTLKSKHGERTVPLAEFYQGVRKTVMTSDEMLLDVSFRGMHQDQRGCFIKLALRMAQAISLVNVAVILERNGQAVKSASITLGAVAPTIIHAAQAEAYLDGRSLDEETLEKAATLAMGAARPISDVRSSAGYRRTMVKVVTRRALGMIARGAEKFAYPEDPILLWGEDPYKTPVLSQTPHHFPGTSIVTRINGKQYSFESGHDKTLLRLLREDGGLIGTKEGCAEGECGACTVFLDGIAVMSCMVPAPRAHGAEILTIEGLAREGELHPLQQAFINNGAVQCGYCTPGFLMSAVKLLEEQPHPSRNQITQALTGNLCRCTGYYKIIQAIEETSRR
jgi:xanthine dehydrogenase iron-sulfur cluster and FAD-binding subunit A